MEIDGNIIGLVQDFLSVADEKGWKWAAFDLKQNRHIEQIHGFESADEATRFCYDANNYFSYAEQEFIDAHYQYLSMKNLRASVYSPKLSQISEKSIEQYMAKLSDQGLGLLYSRERDQLFPLMRSGAIFPVTYERQIEPEKEIDRFIVVSHHHPGHHVYEIGHSTAIMDEFKTRNEAEQYFASITRQSHDGKDKNDYQLIGLYRGTDYKPDLEGSPESYCGLTLKHAFYMFDTDITANAWKLLIDNDISEPVNIRHFLYSQFDPVNEKFQLMDGQLKEIDPEKLKASTYPNYYITEKLTIKQLEIMNEQSYDYVANQLKYLGFGEEIAIPLREKMAEGLNEFTLNHSKDFGKDKTESVLQFSKGDDLQKDLTFFNGFDMTLKQEGKEDLKQHFFVGKEYNYTLQERYNMMDGRFVYREQPKVEPKEVNGETKMVPTGETYLAWKGLNFKESDERGNFLPKTMFWRHDKEIMKYPIKELSEPYDKNRLLASLQKGNKPNVTIIRGNDEIKGSIVANLRMQRFDFYDANGQTLFVKPVEKQKLENTVSQEQSQNQAPLNKEAQQQGQAPNPTTDKNEAVAQQNIQNPSHAEAKGQTQGNDEKLVQKDHQKEDAAKEQKESSGQRKKQGIKV